VRNLPFGKTVAGRELLEKHVPDALKELRRLRIATERIAAALEAQAAPQRADGENGP
jgi:hypothetical protein